MPRPASPKLQAFAEAFVAAAGPAVTAVLNRRISLAVTEIATTTTTELATVLPPPWVLAEVTYQRGLSGTHWMIVSPTSALALAGVDPAGADALAVDPAAVAAVVNQVLAAAGPALMPLFARAIVCAPTSVTVVAQPGELPGALAGARERLAIVRAATAPDAPAPFELALVMGGDVLQQIEVLSTPARPSGGSGAEASRRAEDVSRMDLVLDVMLPLAVELGRAKLRIRDILQLAPGSVIELDKMAGDPVELYINDRPFATGEVVVIDETFGVRLISIVTASERIRMLR